MKPMSITPPVIIICIILSLKPPALSDCNPCHLHQSVKRYDQKFEQKAKRFYEFNEQTQSWVEVGLPYHLVSCTSGNCTVVGSIQELGGETERRQHLSLSGERKKKEHDQDELEGDSYAALHLRKRISLTMMSETSVWITGISGSIYERFWNGMQWVIAPHDLPVSAGYAVSVFIVNQKILALSEAGVLYQMQLSEDSQPIWIEFMPEFDRSASKETDQSSRIQLSSGVLSNDRERLYFCTKTGLLLELLGADPPRWVNHGRPPGADVASIADAAIVRPGLLFTVSSAGDLYEYDQTSKPPWKKHIHKQESLTKETALAPMRACSLSGLVGTHSVSLFFLTKGGELSERRLHQRKWKWLVHGNPHGHRLSSITCVSQDEQNEDSKSLFLTTAAGFVFEYHIQKYPGSSQHQIIEDNWLNHSHPPQAKVARGIPGLQFQPGRIIFPLDDGRLVELHLSGLGGENLGPNSPTSTRRKSLLKYTWSMLDAPETEGWNAEYCTEERGPSNCILGTKGESTQPSAASRWRKDSRTQQNYLSFNSQDISVPNPGEEYAIPETSTNEFFRLRLVNSGNSFFLVTGNGLTFEYLNTESGWFWLTHEHSTGMRGALGNYNGSLFLVDEHQSLFIRERSSVDLAWMNCTAMRRGRKVVGGPPWDGVPGQAARAKADDAIFFVSKSGRLLQFTVALRKFKWKDCKSPPDVKIASIVDQEGFRDNVVFIVGKNGRLYQYNKVTQLWHQHHQSQHLVLSRSPGTAMRLSRALLKGSLFMLSENGGLVEYQWSSLDGWKWIEHGTPRTNVTLVGAPGPCIGGAELFLIGSDGSVYLRYFDQVEWKWKDYGYPYMGCKDQKKDGDDEVCVDTDFEANLQKFEENFGDVNKNCNSKVSSTRPIPFSEESVIFELQDGRLAEMRRIEDKNTWMWSRTIGTPTSLCMANFWASLAS